MGFYWIQDKCFENRGNFMRKILMVHDAFVLKTFVSGETIFASRIFDVAMISFQCVDMSTIEKYLFTSIYHSQFHVSRSSCYNKNDSKNNLGVVMHSSDQVTFSTCEKK